MVKWNDIDGKIVDVTQKNIGFAKILSSDWNTESSIVKLPSDTGNQGTNSLYFDVASILTPIMGKKYWNRMWELGEQSRLKDDLVTYYGDEPTPRLFVDSIRTETDEFPIRYICTKEETPLNISPLIQSINNTFGYDRVYYGVSGDIIEIQFLNSSARGIVHRNNSLDTADPGLFLNIKKNNINIAAGLHRIVCKNGLTDRFNIWDMNASFIGREFIQRSMDKIRWLFELSGKGINSLKELAVLTEGQPRNVVKSCWEEWSLRLENKDLTWFDVIDSLTRSANSTLGTPRYRSLEFSDDVKDYFDDPMGYKCPVCRSRTISSNEIERSVDVEYDVVEETFGGCCNNAKDRNEKLITG